MFWVPPQLLLYKTKKYLILLDLLTFLTEPTLLNLLEIHYFHFFLLLQKYFFLYFTGQPHQKTFKLHNFLWSTFAHTCNLSLSRSELQKLFDTGSVSMVTGFMQRCPFCIVPGIDIDVRFIQQLPYSGDVVVPACYMERRFPWNLKWMYKNELYWLMISRSIRKLELELEKINLLSSGYPLSSVFASVILMQQTGRNCVFIITRRSS